MSITYLKGDATDPQGPGPKIIVHVCNDVGGWGRGFVVSLSKRWPEIERSYRRWFEKKSPQLGMNLIVEGFHQGDDRIIVINMVAQHDVVIKNNVHPIRYDALERCLEQVAPFATSIGASVHMPRIGCGLAGGRWSVVEEIINRTLLDIPIFVYDLDVQDEQTIKWNP